MKINNKEILQSYILTTAKYDYSVYEKRILYKIVEQLQYLIEGKMLDKDILFSKVFLRTQKNLLSLFHHLKKMMKTRTTIK